MTHLLGPIAEQVIEMAVIVVICRACGIEFAPDRESIVAGAWRLCPDCRSPAETERGREC